MKTELIIIGIIVSGFNANAQTMKTEEVPVAAKTKVASLYPNAKVEKWEKEENNFEAELEINKVETSVLIDASGNVLETEKEIAITSLPKAITDYLAKNYHGQRIEESSIIVDSKNVTTYETEIKEGDFIFDAHGNLLKKAASENDKEEKK